MKELLCLLIAFASWGGIQAVTKEDAVSMLENFVEKCEPKATKEDIENIVENKEEVPLSTKCVRRCLLDQLEMWENCKLIPDKVTELTSMMFEDKDDEVVEMVNACNAKVDCADQCVAAHYHAMCMLEEFKTKEWPMPELDKE